MKSEVTMEEETTRSYEKTSFTVLIRDNVSGQEIKFENAKGGFFIVAATPDTPIATDQGVFGNAGAIAIALAKMDMVLDEILEKQPQIRQKVIELNKLIRRAKNL